MIAHTKIYLLLLFCLGKITATLKTLNPYRTHCWATFQSLSGRHLSWLNLTIQKSTSIHATIHFCYCLIRERSILITRRRKKKCVLWKPKQTITLPYIVKGLKRIFWEPVAITSKYPYILHCLQQLLSILSPQ